MKQGRDFYFHVYVLAVVQAGPIPIISKLLVFDKSVATSQHLTCSDVNDGACDDADDVGGDALVQRRVDPGQVLVGGERAEEDGGVVAGQRQQLEHLLDGVEGELVVAEAPFDSLQSDVGFQR